MGVYLYEALGDEAFQELCLALLIRENPAAQCLPVGQRDGGRDGIEKDPVSKAPRVAYQVKWTRDAKNHGDPVKWLLDTVTGEAKNIKRLVEEGLQSYVLMTSVASTAREVAGRADRLDEELAALGVQYGVPMSCWWRDDIDARLDSAPTDILWAYPDMLTGGQALRALMADSAKTSTSHYDDLVRTVLAAQWDADTSVRFKQVGLDSHALIDLFVDVPVRDATARAGTYDVDLGGAQHLLRGGQHAVVLGAPGQGKSTLVQYVCQVHRAAILGHEDFLKRVPKPLHSPSPRVPIKVELRDYAAWLAGQDPFSLASQPDKRQRRPVSSVEAFLAHALTALSGGQAVTVDDTWALLRRLPSLLVLDGLDEVASEGARAGVVEEMHRFLARLKGQGCDAELVVTARPSFTGLAEPARDRFHYFELQPLPAHLRTAYLRKWAKARGLSARDRRELQDTFAGHADESHVDELATNPMQMSILLHLMHQRGHAIPSQRTPLYSNYMSLFLDREGTKDPQVLRHRPLLEEVTAYLGWWMHSEAEVSSDAGRVSLAKLKKVMRHYLVDQGKDVSLVDTLFTAVTTRVWVLTSRTQGVFEFEVQPVREFFAARYLAESAPATSDDRGKAHRLAVTLERPYWLNTARFLAGFFTPGELSGLADKLEDLHEGLTPSRLWPRRVTRVLLADGILADRPRAQRRAVEASSDDLGTRTLAGDLWVGSAVDLPAAHGGANLAELLQQRLQDDPEGALTSDRAVALRMQQTQKDLAAWWSSTSSPARPGWARLGAEVAAFGNITAQQCAKLAALPEGPALLVRGGARPAAAPAVDAAMCEAVVDGDMNGEVQSATTAAYALVALCHPARMLERLRHYAGEDLSEVGLAPSAPSDARRAAALKRLKQTAYSPLVSALRESAGQAGTTSVWVNVGGSLNAVHPGCWLARDIAVIGAACSDLITGGDVARSGSHLGPKWDAGVMVRRIRENRDNVTWWRQYGAEVSSTVDRATFVLALLTVAGTEVVRATVPTLRAALAGVAPSDLTRLHCTSARIGLSETARRIPDSCLDEVQPDEPDLVLLMTDHVGAGAGDIALDRLDHPAALQAAATGARALVLLEAAWRRWAAAPDESGYQQLLQAAGPAVRLGTTARDRRLTESVAAQVLASARRLPVGGRAGRRRQREQRVVPRLGCGRGFAGLVHG